MIGRRCRHAGLVVYRKRLRRSLRGSPFKFGIWLIGSEWKFTWIQLPTAKKFERIAFIMLGVWDHIRAVAIIIGLELCCDRVGVC